MCVFIFISRTIFRTFFVYIICNLVVTPSALAQIRFALRVIFNFLPAYFPSVWSIHINIITLTTLTTCHALCAFVQACSTTWAALLISSMKSPQNTPVSYPTLALARALSPRSALMACALTTTVKRPRQAIVYVRAYLQVRTFDCVRVTMRVKAIPQVAMFLETGMATSMLRISMTVHQD